MKRGKKVWANSQRATMSFNLAAMQGDNCSALKWRHSPPLSSLASWGQQEQWRLAAPEPPKFLSFGALSGAHTHLCAFRCTNNKAMLGARLVVQHKSHYCQHQNHQNSPHSPNPLSFKWKDIIQADFEATHIFPTSYLKYSIFLHMRCNYPLNISKKQQYYYAFTRT